MRPLALLACLLASLPLPAVAGMTMDRLRAEKVITFSHREAAAPLSYTTDQGKPGGYAVELCERVAEALRRQLALDHLEIRWRAVPAGEALDRLAKGEADLDCGDATVTLAAMAQVDFSLATYADGGGYITGSDKVGSLADLKGRKLGVVGGSSAERALRGALERKRLDTELVAFPGHREGMAAMAAGQVDAYAAERALLGGLILAACQQTPWRLGDELFSLEPYALPMRRDDPDFRLAVNRELARLYRSREIRDIHERWLGPAGKAGPLLDSLYFLNALPE